MSELNVNASLIFIYIENAWSHYKHDIPAKIAWAEMYTWLLDNVGSIGDTRIDHLYWSKDQCWCWSLTNAGLYDLPMGVYFKHRIDATRFLLTFPDASITR
jgi:hypothetical protein